MPGRFPVDWVPVDRELEQCPQCGRELSWWTMTVGRNEPNQRRSTCACGAHYIVDAKAATP